VIILIKYIYRILQRVGDIRIDGVISSMGTDSAAMASDHAL
jgi:hypothetical protein